MTPTNSKTEPTPERKAAIKAVRNLARHERPGPDELVDRGEIDEPVPHGQFMELLGLVGRIKRERERLGLSLTDVSERSRLTRAAVSRLENGWNANPTLDTLYRYALSVNLHIKLSDERLPADHHATDEANQLPKTDIEATIRDDVVTQGSSLRKP